MRLKEVGKTYFVPIQTRVVGVHDWGLTLLRDVEGVLLNVYLELKASQEY